jgi:hypothetical protein
MLFAVHSVAPEFNIVNTYLVPPGLGYAELLDLLSARAELRRVCLDRIEAPDRLLGYAAIATGAGREVEVSPDVDPRVLRALEHLVPGLLVAPGQRAAGSSAASAAVTIASGAMPCAS